MSFKQKKVLKLLGKGMVRGNGTVNTMDFSESLPFFYWENVRERVAGRTTATRKE